MPADGLALPAHSLALGAPACRPVLAMAAAPARLGQGAAACPSACPSPAASRAWHPDQPAGLIHHRLNSRSSLPASALLPWGRQRLSAFLPFTALFSAPPSCSCKPGGWVQPLRPH